MNPTHDPGPGTRHARGLALMLSSTLFFTGNVLLIRAIGGAGEVDIWFVSAVRFAVGLGIVALFYRREVEPRHLLTRRKLVARGIVGGLSTCGFYLTIVHLGAGRAVFIGNTYVVFGAILAVWMLGERFRMAVLAGGIASLAGLALLTNAFATGAARPGPYDLLAIAVSVAAAYIVVTIRQLHETEHTATIFASQCAYGLLFCAIPAMPGLDGLSAAGFWLSLLAGLCAGAGQLTMTHAYRHLPVGEGSLLQMLVPLGTALGGLAFFQERFTPHEVIGAGLILGGTAFTALRR